MPGVARLPGWYPTAIALRVAAGPAGDGDAVRWACFASLSYGELVGPANRKIVGLAQVRRRKGTAICAGLLLGQPDWPRLVRVWLAEKTRRWRGRCGKAR